MTCYHPAKGFIVGFNSSTQKKQIVYCSWSVDHVEVLGTVRKLNESTGELERVKQFKRVYEHGQKYPESMVIRNYIELPCGKCIGCRLKYSRDWATRMMCELKCTENGKACFITLTYDDAHVPFSLYKDADTGDYVESLTLRKRDYQLFMKRLRKHYQDELLCDEDGNVVYDEDGKPKKVKIRFYACGEYGSKTFRPHYHAILYGVDFSEDRYPWSRSKTGFIYYRSPTLECLWPYGNSLVCDVSYDTCAYVSRYVTKKLNGKAAEYYEYFNIQPEFSTMSLKPGIGREYYELHKHDIYENDEMFLSDANGGKRVRPPRYYDKLFDVEYPYLSSRIKSAHAKMVDNISSQMLEKYDGTYLEQLQSTEDVWKSQRFLKRRLE